MYPAGELKRLAARKILVRARVALHRVECRVHTERVIRPLRWIDDLQARWRMLSPLAKTGMATAGVLLPKLLFRRRMTGPMLKWGPLLFQLAKAGLAARRQSSRAPAR